MQQQELKKTLLKSLGNPVIREDRVASFLHSHINAYIVSPAIAGCLSLYAVLVGATIGLIATGFIQ